MAAVSWTGASGDWTDAADWSTDAVPDGSDNVTLPGTTTYAVTMSTALEVDSITLNDGGASLVVGAAGLKDVVKGDVDNDNGTVDVASTAASGSYFDIERNFTNHGTFDVDAASGQGGSRVSIVGTLTNTNTGTLVIGAADGTAAADTIVDTVHLSNSNIIDIQGGTGAQSAEQATLDVTGDVAPATLSGQSLNLSGRAVLEFASGEITSIAAGAELTLDGAHARIADSGVTGESALTGLASNGGNFTLADGAELKVSGAFDNTGTFWIADDAEFSTAAGTNFTNGGTLDVGYEYLGAGTVSEGASGILIVGGSLTNTGSMSVDTASFGGSVTVEGTLGNSGTLVIGNQQASTVVKMAHLDNTASITLISNTQNNSVRTALEVTGDDAPSILAAGVSLSLNGNAIIEYAGGEITSIANGASLTLNGADAKIEDIGTTDSYSLAMLASNAGTLTVEDGAAMPNAAVAFTNTGIYTIENGGVVKTLSKVNFTNSGTLDIDSAASAAGGTAFHVGGTLSNTATMVLGNITSLTVASAVAADVMTNSGTLDIYSTATAAGVTVTDDFTNTGTLYLKGPLASLSSKEFLQQGGTVTLDGGTITTTNGLFLTGGTINGGGTIDGNVTVNGGLLSAGTPTDSQKVTIDGTLAVNDHGELAIALIGSDGGSISLFKAEGEVDILGGTLLINIPDPQDLTAGESFTLLKGVADDLNGEFSNLQYGSTVGTGSSVDLGNGLTLDALYDYTDGDIVLNVVETDSSAAPAVKPALIAAPTIAAVVTEDGFHFSSKVMSALAGVTGMDAAISGAHLSDLADYAGGLEAHHALLFTQTGGSHPGAVYLVIDANGEAGYQAGQDLVVKLDSQEATAFSHFG